MDGNLKIFDAAIPAQPVIATNPLPAANGLAIRADLGGSMQLNVSDLIGVPFVDGGRDPDTGLDCWGLFMIVMDRLGTPVPDYKISCFDSTEIGRAARHALATQWKKVYQPAPGVGLVLDIDPAKPGIKQHFGVCVSKDRFIHTLEKTGVILTKLSDGFWKAKIKGMYKWKK